MAFFAPLATIGTAAAPVVTVGAVASTIASAAFATSGFWLPAVLPSDKVEQPKVPESSVGSASEGSPIYRCYGPHNRIAGTIIAVSDKLNQEKVLIDVGLFGNKNTTYKYNVDFAVGLCAGPIHAITKVWANGTVRYDAATGETVVSDELSATVVYGIFGLNLMMRIEAPVDGVDLTKFRTGLTVVVSGFANSVNNGVKLVLRSGGLVGGGTYVTVYNPNTIAESAGATVTIDQPLLELFDPRVFKFVRGYNGTDTQTADAVFAKITHGVIPSPAYRHLAYLAIESLPLGDFGNRIPQVHTEVAATEDPQPLSEVITDICLRSGVVDIDVTGVTGTVDGYAIPGPISAVDALRPLMVAYNVSARESDGTLIFFDRGDEDVVQIDEDDLSAFEFGTELPDRKLVIGDRAGADLPSEVNVQYLDIKKDMQRGGARERRINAPVANAMQIDLPVVLTETRARQIARRILWQAWINRQTASFSLPPKYLHLEEGDRAVVTVDGEQYVILVTDIDRGANMLIQVRGLIESDAPNDLTDIDGDDGTGSGDQVYVPPALAFTAIDIAPFRSAEIRLSGYHYGLAAFDPLVVFQGALVERGFNGSFDGITVYVDSPAIEQTLGLCQTTLADGPVGMWDYANTLDVELYEGSLESRTDFEVYQGLNRAVVGDEVIGFQDATLIATNTYRLSTLLRGLRGTENEAPGHGSAERFVLVPIPGLPFVDEPITTVFFDQDVTLRAIPDGGDPDLSEPLTLDFACNVQRPFAPTNIEGSRDGSNNLTISWVRRSRDPDYSQFMGAPPLIEDVELYGVDIYQPSTTTILRTIAVVDATELQYSAANQTSDGYTPGDPIECGVYQISSVGLGKGRIAAVTL